MTPLLEARGACIGLGGATLVDNLDLRTEGRRIVLAGDAGGLMSMIMGTPRGHDGDLLVPRLTRGSLALAGRAVDRGEHRELAGFAPLDPPLPPRWRVDEWLSWHARLAGKTRRQASSSVRATLSLLEMDGLTSQRLDRLQLLERRAATLAAAIVHNPAVLVIEDPFAQLDQAAAQALAALVAHASADREVILSLPSLATEGPSGSMLESASDIGFFRGGHLIAHGPPATLLGGARLYELAVHDNGAALERLLAARGIALAGGPRYYTLEMPEGACASDLLAVAAEAGTPVISCTPLL